MMPAVPWDSVTGMGTSPFLDREVRQWRSTCFKQDRLVLKDKRVPKTTDKVQRHNNVGLGAPLVFCPSNAS